MSYIKTTLLAAAIGVAPLLAGCSEHYRVAAYPAHDTVVYEPGYYYDREYYDPAGHFHDRHYYYYDGHRWGDRDGIPAGFTARERHEMHEAHDRHEEHREHFDHDVD